MSKTEPGSKMIIDRKNRVMTFCCGTLMEAVITHNIIKLYDDSSGTEFRISTPGSGPLKIEYCPFCGAKISIKK
jgi:hypothetical protein